MVQTLLDNLSSAILALVLATMVWMVAVNEGQGPLEVQWYPHDGLRIEIVNLPDGLVLFDELDRRVKARIRGPRLNIDQLSPADFRAFVDLSGFSAGLREVPVEVQCAECAQKRVNVLDWDPRRISVRVDEAVTQLVPVEANLQGATAVGYQAQPPQFEPKHVAVSGPRTRVEEVVVARADVYLFNEDTSVQREVPLTAADGKGNLVRGVTLNPNRVKITVPIIPQGRRKEVSVTPNITGTVASGYYASSISVQPQTVVLIGPRSLIQETPGYVETAPISIEGAKSRVEVRVPLEIPEGLELLNPSDASVTVVVDITPFKGGRTFEVTPTVRNLKPGLDAQVSPPRVQVFLFGPLPDLEALSESGLQVILDLEGRLPGRHRIQPVVEVGQDLEAQTLPEVVEVNITVRPTNTPKPIR